MMKDGQVANEVERARSLEYSPRQKFGFGAWTLVVIPLFAVGSPVLVPCTEYNDVVFFEIKPLL